MKRIVEFVMDSEEYCIVANIIGSEKRNVEMMANKLTKEDAKKGELIDFLYNVATQLDIANNILKDV